jgi:DNA-binding Xre family transcriptional regulator
MAERNVTAYRLAADSGGRISQSTAYRLADGTKESLRLEEIAALCDVLEVDPGQLFELKRAGKRG